MTEKCRSFYIFQKHLNKSIIWKINSYVSIITQILNTSKAELTIYYNKSKRIQIQVHFHFVPTLNTIARGGQLAALCPVSCGSYVIIRASFCCSKKVRKLHLLSTKVAFMRRKLHLWEHLTFDCEWLNITYFRLRRRGQIQDFPHFHLQLSSGTVVLGWGCKTSSFQTNCIVIDNIETQLVRHMALSHAIKENRTKLK